MALNLKSRLGRIRDAGKAGGFSGEAKQSPCGLSSNGLLSAGLLSGGLLSAASWSGWEKAGFGVLKRELCRELTFPLPAIFPDALAILVPDLVRFGHVPSPEELLFFDLETTGLSGGAGTVAFLAAFGRFIPPVYEGFNDIHVNDKRGIAIPARLTITQYLLLDYPGEADFIETITKEFTSSFHPLVVSFNGKSFDSQILKTRCLMNGIVIPEYFHADLLHPARRLWRRVLSNCSQATVEVSILGLDRDGDVSGAMAPEIWFSFLRSGENHGNNSEQELLSVCDHNARDIVGLASLFLCLGEIAAEPFRSRKRFRFDEEALALAWRSAVKKSSFFFADDKTHQRYAETGELLLQAAAENGWPRAVFTLGLDLFKNGRNQEGRALMLKITQEISDVNSDESELGADNFADGKFTDGKFADAFPRNIKAAAFKALAIDAEWRLGDYMLALAYTRSALNFTEISGRLRKDLEKRQLRLLAKT